MSPTASEGGDSPSSGNKSDNKDGEVIYIFSLGL